MVGGALVLSSRNLTECRDWSELFEGQSTGTFLIGVIFNSSQILNIKTEPS